MENQRNCTICCVIKPFSEFFWDKRFNLPFSRCKPCYNAKCKEYRASAKGKNTNKIWASGPSGKEVRKKAMKTWIMKNPEKHSAKIASGNAIRDGRLIKSPCEVCGNVKVEGHHDSYLKENWLKVRWLCKLHHVQITFAKD